MPSGHGERYDFFLSRRGSVAAIAQEIEQVLAQKRYSVLTQETFRSHRVLSRNEGVINSRDLIVLFTHDYLQSRYTRKDSRASRKNGRAKKSATSSSCAASAKRMSVGLSSATCGAAIHTGRSSVNRRAITAIRRTWRGGRGSAEAICSG